MEVKPGTRLRSVADATEIIVVKAPKADVDLRCGGHPMAPIDAPPGDAPVASGFDQGTLIGKRYAHDRAGLEVLCTVPGAGALSVGPELLELKQAKALPSSD